jgi:hypothetical protein
VKKARIRRETKGKEMVMICVVMAKTLTLLVAVAGRLVDGASTPCQ